MATVLKENSATWLTSQIAKGRTGTHACMVKLTPELASEILDRNFDNRNINQLRVGVYASDITEGRWAANGESIIISRDGLLNDGQHRCAAVVQANKSIDTLIVFGVDRETRMTTNMGKVKGAGDFAAMDGLPNANVLAAMSRLAIAFETGSAYGGNTASTPRVLEYIHTNKDALIPSMHFATRYAGKLSHMVSATPVAFCHYVCAKINQPAADEFFTQVCLGEMLQSGDPAFVTRARMLQLGKARMPKVEAMLHGWNAFRRGQVRTIIRLTGSLPQIV